jgi:hypothetical protein
MVIRSSHLRAALQAVIGYYPGFEIIQDDCEIEAPFRVLVHHWKALERYKLDQPACHDAEYAATTSRHIDVLLAFLEDMYSQKLALETSRWANPAGGTATFDLFWLLLEPGQIVYHEKDGQMVPFIVSELDIANQQGATQPGYEVWLWNICFSKGRMQRTSTKVVVHPWNGERLIHTLSVIPARFIPGGEDAVAEEQIKLGRLFWDLAKQPSYKDYDGRVVFKSDKKAANVSSPSISPSPAAEPAVNLIRFAF